MLLNDSSAAALKICPLKQFLALVKREGASGKAAVISTSFEVPRSLLEELDCVILRYDDVDREIPGRSMSSRDADRAADFIRAHSQFRGILYCCCDSGVSRSSAMAAAAARYLGEDDLPIWQDPHYSPNPLVYEQMCRSLGISVSDEALDLRLETSRRALAAAIRSQR